MNNRTEIFERVENFNIAACDSVIRLFGDASIGRIVSENKYLPVHR